MRIFVGLFLMLIVVIHQCPQGLADDEPVDHRPANVKKDKNIKTKRLRYRGDIEGSRAQNRFHHDQVIRSAYKMNGVPLEVDPD